MGSGKEIININHGLINNYKNVTVINIFYHVCSVDIANVKSCFSSHLLSPIIFLKHYCWCNKSITFSLHYRIFRYMCI